MDTPKEVIPDVPHVLPTKSNREKLLEVAQTATGDVSPKDRADDDVACVESVCEILKRAGLPTSDTLSTIQFKKWIGTHPGFKQTLDLTPGNIILTVTGTGNGTIKNGHVGIIGDKGRIYSNNSYTGNWDDSYTIESWVARWRTKGGMPIYVYEAQ